jgi:hypothetical protein
MTTRDTRAKVAASVAFGIAVLTLTTVAAGEPLAGRQRISITGKGETHTFVLTPLTAGALRRDSGRFSDCCWRERIVVRAGQKVEINDPIATYTGQRGTFVLRYRVEWVNAGNGYTVGTGAWKVIRGTGAYAGVTGEGRSAATWLRDSFVSFRAEGLVQGR